MNDVQQVGSLGNKWLKDNLLVSGSRFFFFFLCLILVTAFKWQTLLQVPKAFPSNDKVLIWFSAASDDNHPSVLLIQTINCNLLS